MTEKLNLFYKLLKAETPSSITSELTDASHSVKKVLSNACELASKQLSLGKQIVHLTDASFRSASYAFMIEVNTDMKI